MSWKRGRATWGIWSSARHLRRLLICSADGTWLLLARRGADQGVYPAGRNRVVEQHRLQEQSGGDSQQGAKGAEHVRPEDQGHKGGCGADTHRVPSEPWL